MKQRWHVGRLVLVCTALWCLAGCATARYRYQPVIPPKGVRTVVLVRHAEKDAGRDPSLSSAGVARATALAETLDRAAVTQIITSDLRRTQQTAQPTVQRSGVQPTVVPTMPDLVQRAEQIAQLVRAADEGAIILVVGHSNTIPLAIAALGIMSPPEILDGDYDHFFLVQISVGRPSRLVVSRYGRPDSHR